MAATSPRSHLRRQLKEFLSNADTTGYLDHLKRKRFSKVYETGKRCHTSLFKEILDERDDDRGSKTDKDVSSCSVAVANFKFYYQFDKSPLSSKRLIQ